jgi:hypothetical protein
LRLNGLRGFFRFRSLFGLRFAKHRFLGGLRNGLGRWLPERFGRGLGERLGCGLAEGGCLWRECFALGLSELLRLRLSKRLQRRLVRRHEVGRRFRFGIHNRTGRRRGLLFAS